MITEFEKGDTMPRFKIKATIENKDEKKITEAIAIYQDDVIKYKDEDNSTVIYNYKKRKLTRDNEKIKIEYIFNLENETTGLILIKELNKTISLSIITKEIVENNNNIEIEFKLDNDLFKYRIEVIK